MVGRSGSINLSESIVITGATGFLGSWLAHYYFSMGYKTFALGRPKDKTSRLLRFPNNQLFLADVEKWPGIIAEIKPTSIISADWAGVDAASRNSPKVQSENLSRVMKLAESAVANQVKNFLTFGSQAENGPINVAAEEKNYDCATTAYGQGKIQLRRSLEKFFENTSVRFIWGRIFSTYGPFDNPEWLLPSLIRSLLKKEKFALTTGKQIWSYLHAHDLCRATQMCLNDYSISGLVNIGNDEVSTIYDYACHLGNLMDGLDLLEFGNEDFRADQVMHLEPINRTLSTRGWEPSIHTLEGLKDLVKWHKSGSSPLDPFSLYRDFGIQA